jgi:predicted ATP-grasp superfamily ATP-dependent carboligase
MLRVLVTDAEDRAVLAACRSLTDAGYEVSAVAGARPAPTHWSRSCRERFHLPHPRTDPEAFVEGLAGLVAGDAYALLLPGTDASLLAVSAGRERLEPHVRLGLPADEVVRRCFDKWEVGERARAAGLGPPETELCSTAEEALTAARRLGFPVVLKPRHSALLVDGAIRRRGSRPVEDEDELAAELSLYGLPCLVQRCSSGAILSTSAVAAGEGGGLLGFGASRYARVFPPEGGSVSFSTTVEPPAGLEQKVAHLVEGLGWRGVFELELLEDGDALAAIDFNPRFYGSMALATAAGAPLAAIWCDLLLGRDTARRPGVRPNVHYRWEDADLRHMLRQLRRGRVREGIRVLRPHRHVVHALFRLRDPGPLAARLALSMRRRARRGLEGGDP